MKIKRNGSAVWLGNFSDGQGNVSTQSGALRSYPFSVDDSFHRVSGSSPQELIAAAHASCYAMTFAVVLNEAHLHPEQIFVAAEATLDQQYNDVSITTIHLSLQTDVPDADLDTLQALADIARIRCPISKLLRAQITLDISLASSAAA